MGVLLLFYYSNYNGPYCRLSHVTSFLAQALCCERKQSHLHLQRSSCIFLKVDCDQHQASLGHIYPVHASGLLHGFEASAPQCDLANWCMTSSKELNLSAILNQTWSRPDLDLNWPELDSKSPYKGHHTWDKWDMVSNGLYSLSPQSKKSLVVVVSGRPNLVLAQGQVFGP